MAIEIEVVSDNTAELLSALETQVEAALEACGNQAVSHAQKNITEASRVDTGAMRNSITHEVDGSTCYVGTNIEYAIYHEYGTGIYADGGNGRKTPWFYVDEKGVGHWTRGIKPIHFLKNAISDNISEYKEILTEYLSK